MRKSYTLIFLLALSILCNLVLAEKSTKAKSQNKLLDLAEKLVSRVPNFANPIFNKKEETSTKKGSLREKIKSISSKFQNTFDDVVLRKSENREESPVYPERVESKLASAKFNTAASKSSAFVPRSTVRKARKETNKVQHDPVAKQNLGHSQAQIKPEEIPVESTRTCIVFYGHNLRGYPVTKKIYRLKNLGQGAYGSTSLVVDCVTEDKYVLKKYKPKVSIDSIMREVRMANMMGYLVGYYPKKRQVLLKFVEGDVLTDYEDLNSPLYEKFDLNSLGERLMFYNDKLYEPLESIHARGVVHNDNHPGNIVVNDQGRAEVIDFGFAEKIEDSPRKEVPIGILLDKFIAACQTLIVTHKHFRERVSPFVIGANIEYSKARRKLLQAIDNLPSDDVDAISYYDRMYQHHENYTNDILDEIYRNDEEDDSGIHLDSYEESSAKNHEKYDYNEIGEPLDLIF
ncbi:hypothetical protein ROZALSC1DRAFT_28960 [Rozella allomycis CSF55]|uniref:non-specific serine/threonine protein kinase n=1 Tax=Rozella allomycis (strain CSF55) TaxID=988480 RepID=A0A4P9YKQ0_ROZAC|nr:hypothetical protein ROZALSC1DRAFT_28960 [Rozella allomycis CSF55]